MISRVAAATVIALVIALPAGWAQDSASAERRGRQIAEAHCARCHAVGRTGESPETEAPPFRILGQRYPVHQLAESLAEGIITGHVGMPEFSFSPADVEALIAFLEGLQEEGAPKR